MELGSTELSTVISAAQGGYWLPFAVLSTAWGVIIGLLLYIYSRNQKENEKRHSENTAILKTLAENTQDLKTLVKINQVEIKHLKESA
jgi:hypothetical protein